MTLIAYLDTNALVKLYLPEPSGEPRIGALLDLADGVATSVITYPESRGVFARALTRDLITQAEHDARLAAFESDWLTLTPVALSEKVYRRAGNLMAAHPRLRGMDAIQLSSALEVREAVSLRFLSFDADLEAVAQALLHKDEIQP